MQFDLITIFPQIFDSYLQESLFKRAQKKKIIKVKIHNLRDYTKDKHRTVDDKPYGGGPGMVFKVGPIYECLKKLKLVKQSAFATKQNASRVASADKAKKHIILLTPTGKQFDQKMAKRLAKYDKLVFICGRYEGVDARVEKMVDEKISVGPYVLSGGELPALTIMEAVARYVPGFVGKEESLKEESFNSVDYLEYPQYTRPENFKGQKVPKVLLSGNHKEIEKWKKKHAK